MEKEIAMTVMDESTPELDLPGFRFHPTEEELLGFYLKNIVSGRKLHYDIIGFLNIYLHDPWDLPGRAKIGEREWYFFVPRDRKNGSGGRPNRTTAIGFWKATGSDRKILGSSEPKRMIGHKKTLVFYKGRAPHGTKTDWVMNEYRLPDTCPVQKDIVLCKIYRKATSLKVLEQRATLKQEIKNVEVVLPPSSPMNAQPQKTISFCNQNEGYMEGPMGSHHVAFKKEGDDDYDYVVKAEAEEMNKESSPPSSSSSSTCIKLPLGKDNLPELQVQRFSMDWTQDPLWTQLRSPWLDNFSPYANLLNF